MSSRKDAKAQKDMDEQVTAQIEFENETLKERITALELAMEDAQYLRLSMQSEREFSRDGLRQICEIARTMYLKNPLIQRGVNVQRDYVFGQGISIQADDDEVDEVVQRFLDDDQNQTELTSLQAMGYKEVELDLFGNLFFVFFINPATGRVRVRTMPMDEAAEIVSNPEDSKEAWFYKRVYAVNELDMQTGNTMTQIATAYYPDWHYRPKSKPKKIGGWPVMWDTPVFHVRVGGLADMKFGVSEVYAAIDWALAYKNFLEDWATIVRAYSRFAWQMSTRGGKSAILAAKTKLATTLSSSGEETNPAPIAGSVFIAGEGQKVEPIRTAGATTSADDGRRLLLMVAATMGLPETFFGDVSVGTLATGKSLDRPTELKIRYRQSLWKDIFTKILNFVIYWAVKAGELDGSIVEEEDGTPRVELTTNDTKNNRKAVNVVFPPILEHDVAASVTAIVQAATLGNYQPAGTIDSRTVTRMLLTALGETDVERVLDMLAEEVAEREEEEEAETNQPQMGAEYSANADNADNADEDTNQPQMGAEYSANADDAEDADEEGEGMMEAARELRKAVQALVSRLEG